MTTDRPSTPARSTRRTLGLAAAVAVPAIGAAGFLVPWLAGMGERESSVDTLEVHGSADADGAGADSEAVAQVDAVDEAPDPLADAAVLGEILRDDAATVQVERVIDWAIRVSAPLETFPDAPVPDAWGGHGCSPEQIAWLSEHATTPAPQSVGVRVHNTADTGGALALQNVRFEAAQVDAEPWVRFECPAGGRGGTDDQYVEVDVDGSPATWSSSFGGDGEPEGSLVTVNLSPGEVAELVVARAPQVDRQRAYAGRLVADLADGSGTTVILANDVRFDRDMVPGYFVGYGNVGYESGQLHCGTPDPAGPNEQGRVGTVMTPCTLAEAAQTLRVAAEAVS